MCFTFNKLAPKYLLVSVRTFQKVSQNEASPQFHANQLDNKCKSIMNEKKNYTKIVYKKKELKKKRDETGKGNDSNAF